MHVNDPNPLLDHSLVLRFVIKIRFCYRFSYILLQCAPTSKNNLREGLQVITCLRISVLMRFLFLFDLVN